MKDKKEHAEHEKEPKTHQEKQDQPKSSDHQKDASADFAPAAKAPAQSHDLDHKKLSDFSDKLDKDEVMKAQFQVDPHGTMKQQGVDLPEGYKASYDHQYVKSSDGANRLSHSYGPVKVTK